MYMDKPPQSLHALLKITSTSLSKSEYIYFGKPIVNKFNYKITETPHNIPMESISKHKRVLHNRGYNVKRKIIKQARDSLQGKLVFSIYYFLITN